MNTAEISATKTDRQLDFAYGPEHQRITSQVSLSTNAPSTLHSGSTWYLHNGPGALFYEKEVRTNGTTEHKHYLSAAGQVFALQILREGAGVGASTTTSTSTTSIPASTLNYLHSDRQGSVVVVSSGDASGTTSGTTTGSTAGAVVVERLAYDPWGKRRSTSGQPDPKDLLVGSATERGYTQHEHLDELALIHMNGRVYDPGSARFMSADPVMQNPYNLQSHNRYSYVMNNPLGWVDPSGYEADGFGAGGGFGPAGGDASTWGEIVITATRPESGALDGGSGSGWSVNRSSSDVFQGASAARGGGGLRSASMTAGNAGVLGNPRAAALRLLIALAQERILSDGELLQELAQAAKLAGQEISNVIMQMWLPMPMKVALGLMMMELGEGADKPVPENVGPGTNAGDSVPAGPSARPTKEQQGQINDIGNVDGCHTCGTTDPGTKSGNWVGDHQPPTALNPQGKPQSYYPQCRE